MTEQTDTARFIPDDLSRELCEEVARWLCVEQNGPLGWDYEPGRRYWLEDAGRLLGIVSTVIAKHMNPAPLRDCCDSRMGRQHATDCAALAVALNDNNEETPNEH